MAAEVLLDQEVGVAYGQIYLESSTAQMNGEMTESFPGQTNGLCGAAKPGMLFLITGTHTGNVGFRIELHDQEPPVDELWEEVVEASLRAITGETGLAEWAGDDWHRLPIPPGDYRVRYHAQGMAESDESDRYLLQLWPAPPAPDRIIRVTTADARYWHNWASALAPTPGDSSN